MNPEKKTKIPPIRNILFLDRAYTKILSSMKSTKKAQGLKLSKPARIMVKTGNAIFEGSISPKERNGYGFNFLFVGLFFFCWSLQNPNWIHATMLNAIFYFFFYFPSCNFISAVSNYGFKISNECCWHRHGFYSVRL